MAYASEISVVSVAPTAEDFKSNTKENKYKVYRSRWYVLIVFSLLSSMCSLIYGTFGPIAMGVLYAYPSWSDSTVSMTVNCGSILYVVFVIPVCWTLESIGIRKCTIAGMFQ